MATTSNKKDLDQWSSLPSAMETSVSGLGNALDQDAWWQGFIKTNAIIEPILFGIQSTGSSDAILIGVEGTGITHVSTGNPTATSFLLSAKPEQWQKFS